MNEHTCASKLNKDYPHKLRVKQLHRWYRGSKTDEERKLWKLRMKLLGVIFDEEYLKHPETK